jgi:hypothetical protein
MGKQELDGICSKLTEMLNNLEDTVKILKIVLQNCQKNSNVCPYCLKDLSEEDHAEDCEYKIIIDKYGSGE